MKIIDKFSKKLQMVRKGEKGFTLIELLVVIAILGILAAVVIPNVLGLMDSGRVEAANTEAHDVQIAVLSAMVENNMYEFAAEFSIGPNTTGDANDATTDEGDLAVPFMTGLLQATYFIGTDGAITGAVATTDGKWDGLTYTVNVGWAE